MIAKYKYGDMVWVDLELPTKEELLYIEEEYPDIDLSKERLSIIAKNHDFNLNSEELFTFLTVLNNGEKDKLFIFSNANLIITIHDKHIEALRDILKKLEINIYQNDYKINNKLLLINFLKGLYINGEKELLQSLIHNKELFRTINNYKNKLKRSRLLIILLIIAIIIYYVISII